MNDRFKFRAWDKETKSFLIHNEEDKTFDFNVFNSVLNRPEKYDILQSTGLKDKNGKLIYERDILKAIFTTPHGKIIEKVCKVEFSRCAFWVRDGIRAFYLDNENCVYEVIGSIYENADLLQECE